MRKILMVGTAGAYPPFSNGVQVWVDELTAYSMARLSVPELAYVNARDTVSDAQAGVLWALRRMAAVQAWADRIGGPLCWQTTANTVLPPDGSVQQFGPYTYCFPSGPARYG